MMMLFMVMFVKIYLIIGKRKVANYLSSYIDSLTHISCQFSTAIRKQLQYPTTSVSCLSPPIRLHQKDQKHILQTTSSPSKLCGEKKVRRTLTNKLEIATQWQLWRKIRKLYSFVKSDQLYSTGVAHCNSIQFSLQSQCPKLGWHEISKRWLDCHI